MMKNRFDFTFRCLLALVFTVALAGHASAQLYWSGAGLNPATAGSGTWDISNSQWSSTFPGYTAAVWDTNIANFNGTGGGTVTLGTNINANEINFGANAGAFTLEINPSLNIHGAGITNSSANTQTINDSVNSSSTTFFNSATAGNVTINNSATSSVVFNDSATAAHATINNSGGNSSATFFNSSTAANATINNSGSGSVTYFKITATGANATINNSGSHSSTQFNTNATAENAHIDNSSNNDARTIFGQDTTAANATITNSGTASFTEFNDNSTAANAHITSTAFESATFFHDSATAGNATITNSSTASYVTFYDTSTGGTATLINGAADAFIDISGLTNAGMTAGSIAGAGNLRLGSKNLAVGGNNTSTTFSGVIQDGGTSGGIGGSLTKEGTGTLILSGTNTYTGNTHVNTGSLIVDGSIATSPLTFVHQGGLLGGHGTVANVANSGIVSPGNSPGTLTLTGNYQQNPDGTLRMEIGGLTLAQHDLLAVAAQSFIAGTLQLVQLNNFQPGNGDRVTIITDAGGHTGTFDTVTSNFSGLLRPVVRYDEANDIYVIFQLNSFNIGGLTPNQKSVARNLDVAINDPAAAPLINFLGLEALGNLPHDYDLIAPEELAAIYEISISSSMIQNNNLQRRMDDIRAGSNGFCANGFTPQVSGKDVSKDSGGKMVLDQKQGPDAYVPTANNRWGVFINGTGDFVNVGDADSNAPGYDITRGEFTLGVDYRLCDHFAVGIDGGYSSSRADLVANGRIDTDGGKIGAYATWFGKGFFGSKFYVDGTVGGGLNNYDTRRTGLQNEFVRGDTDGTELNAMISYGSDWTFGCFNIGTWSSVQFTNVNIDEFTETGSLAPLIIEDQDENSFRATTGVHASYDIKAGHVLIRPEVRAAYQHEYCDSAYQVDSQLASGAGGIFRVRGPQIGRDAALVDAGVNVQWNNRISTYVYYDGVLGRNNYDNNAVSGGLRFGF